MEHETLDGEDVEVARCLRNLNVTAGDSRDSLHRERFFPFMPEKHLSPIGNGDNWYRQEVFYPFKQVQSHRHSIGRDGEVTFEKELGYSSSYF